MGRAEVYWRLDSLIRLGRRSVLDRNLVKGVECWMRWWCCWPFIHNGRACLFILLLLLLHLQLLPTLLISSLQLLLGGASDPRRSAPSRLQPPRPLSLSNTKETIPFSRVSASHATSVFSHPTLSQLQFKKEEENLSKKVQDERGAGDRPTPFYHY